MSEMGISIDRHNQFLQSVFNTSLIGISVLEAVRDAEGTIQDFRILIVNKELERETKRNDLVGKLYSVEYPGIKKSGLFDLMLKVMDTGESGQTEYYYPYEGFNKWFSCMFVKVEDGLVATNLDITLRKQAEEEKFKNFLLLQKSELFAQTGSWEYNLESKKLSWSDGMYRLFNLDIGTKVTPDIYLKYSKPQHLAFAQRIASSINNATCDFEYTIEIEIDNHSKSLKLKATVIFDMEGRPEKILGVDMDITAIKEAENKIKENAIFIKGVADAAPDMLYVIDVRTIQMVYANQNIIELFQKSADEISNLGRELFEIYVYPKDKKKFYESIELLKQYPKDEAKELVYRIYDSKKKIHWIKTRRIVFKRDEQGKTSLIIGVSQDVTEQVALQKKNNQLIKERTQLEKTQQHEIIITHLTAQEEERKRIAESLHNGLAQLLYGVKLSLEQIKLHRADLSEDNDRHLKQTAQLLENAILDTRSISHELTPITLDNFGLKASVEDLCIKLNVNKSIIITCELIGFPSLINKYYEIAIYRIIQELTSNIAKHSKATKADVKIKFTKKDTVISVLDNGAGFKFNDETNGGIGLKSLKSKIELLNGTIQFSSIMGGGTSIKVRIPI
jgi:signal transduction histidine kinase